MIIVMQHGAPDATIDAVVARIREHGLTEHVSRGAERTIIGAIGDERCLEPRHFEQMAGVERAIHVVKPWRLVSRETQPGDSVVSIRGVRIGGPEIQVIAGPCSVETPAQMAASAAAVQAAGCRMMRGGAFKPRTSPYSFQGLGVEGLELLINAARPAGLPVVTELMDVRMLDTFLKHDVDVIQIGARNMQNFDLLKEVGRINKPVILKRGLSATVSEWLMAAEYIAAGGNHHIILCERGIRTFETAYRNCLDLTGVLVAKRETHLPVIVDPSHATGIARLVRPMALAAAACGSDGLIIEVHNDPLHALCDGAQSLRPEQYDELAKTVRRVREAVAQ